MTFVSSDSLGDREFVPFIIKVECWETTLILHYNLTLYFNSVSFQFTFFLDLYEIVCELHCIRRWRFAGSLCFKYSQWFQKYSAFIYVNAGHIRHWYPDFAALRCSCRLCFVLTDRWLFWHLPQFRFLKTFVSWYLWKKGDSEN